MKWAFFYELPCPDGHSEVEMYKTMLEEIDYGESLGFDAVWLAELHFNRGLSILPSPMLAAANVASRTKRLRLGIGVNVLALTDPIRRAEDAATLDILSGGRLDFGIGRGHQAIAYEGFGIPMSEARERILENLEIIRKAWTGESFSFNGKFRQVSSLSITPKPLQKPHPPIWLAAITHESFQTAAELGYPAIITGHIPPFPMIQETADLYHAKFKEEHPSSDPRLAALYPVYVTEEESDAYDGPRKHILYYFSYIQRAVSVLPPDAFFHGQTVREFLRIDYEEIFKDRAFFGSPQKVVDRIAMLRDRFKVDYFIAWLNFGAMDHARVLKSMRLFAEKVMPLF
jgi:alkanesulfonate monooxygenase SsuD/methylene tetrahydromethanopterin reductase-like flavin-dependent oxidoreductase (luciferase family)